jgi:hypothetical protein
VHNGVFYVLGGAVLASARDQRAGIAVTGLWDLHAFTPASASEPWRGGAWAAVRLTGAAPAAHARYGCGLYSAAQAQRGRELWLFCGRTNCGYSAEVYVVDLPTGAVRCLAPPLHCVTPRARLGASAVPLPDGTFLLAGGATERVNTLDAFVFHPDTHAWAPVALQAPAPQADPRGRLRDAEAMASALLRQSLVTFPAPAASPDGDGAAVLFWGGGLYVTAAGFQGQQACSSLSDLVVLQQAAPHA